MSILIKNAEVYFEERLAKKDVLIDDHGIVSVADTLDVPSVKEIIDGSGYLVAPGLIDPHVHLREPGFEYKETIQSGSEAAAKGGFTTVMAMPNLNPVPDSVSNLRKELELIEKNAVIKVIPYGSITKGQKGKELSPIASMSELTFCFSDDGKGVQKEEMMLEAMKEAVHHNCLIAAHCEDESLIKKGACIHDGYKAEELNLIGISSESEYKQIERDCMLALSTGCQYHVCHVSCKESLQIIRDAKNRGANITCEVTPHHLILCEDDITEDDGKFKMNPPLRTREDRQALIDGLLDGTIDMIATDHAPHSEEEKSRGLKDSAMGIVGSELAFPLIYTHLVRPNIITLKMCLELMSSRCAEVFGIDGGVIEEGSLANLAVFDLNHSFTIDPKNFKSKGHATPFAYSKAYGECVMTFYRGKCVYRR